MKALFIISNTRIGGAENFTLRLASGLKKRFPESQFDCLITHTNGGLNERYRAVFDSYSTAFIAATTPQKIARIKQAIGGYDIVHSVDNFELFAMATQDGWRCKEPIVQNVFLDVTRPEHSYILDWVNESTQNLSAIVTEHGQNLSALCKPEKAPHTVRQIMNGVDTEFWTPEALIMPTPRQKKVCWVGRLTERKGGRILEALIRRLNTVRFTVIANEPNTSPGFLHRDFLELARQCPNLEYRWGLSPDVLREVYRSSQVYLHTSLSEAQPGTLLEAMSCGCYPIAGAVGGVPQIVSGRGVLVDMQASDREDRFAAAIAETLTQNTLSPRGRIAQHFSLEGAVDKYAELYREILRNSPE